MKNILILLLLIACFGVTAQNTEDSLIRKEFYGNGDVKIITHITSIQSDWMYSGPIELYKEGGVLFLEAELKDHYLHGDCKFYGENQNVIYEGRYEKGSKEGEWRVYDESGKVLFSERDHDYINLWNTHRYLLEDSAIDLNTSEMYFLDEGNELEAYSEEKNGKEYRVISFKGNEVYFSNGFEKKNKDVIVTTNSWGQVELKFRKRVKLILVDFYDDGCNEPETRFVLKNWLRKTIGGLSNISFFVQNAVFSNSKKMRKTKYFNVSQCEGFTERIVIVYQ